MTQDAIWTELSLRVAQHAADDVADLLQQATGSGVTIEPPIEALGPDEGYILDTKAPYTLRAYLYCDVPPARPRAMRDRIRRAGRESALTGNIVWSTLREEDWAGRGRRTTTSSTSAASSSAPPGANTPQNAARSSSVSTPAWRLAPASTQPPACACKR